METSNIIALILGGVGFIISVISLVVSPTLNLKSKRLEKRLEYRFLMFQKILELWESTNKDRVEENEVKFLLKDINKLTQLYGYNQEIKLFREVVNDYNYLAENQTEESRQKLIKTLNIFFTYAFNRYRKEIVLERLED